MGNSLMCCFFDSQCRTDIYIYVVHCLDVLRDLVQEENLERNGWPMSKKIVWL